LQFSYKTFQNKSRTELFSMIENDFGVNCFRVF
jgi:hypothetical protein